MMNETKFPSLNEKVNQAKTFDVLVPLVTKSASLTSNMQGRTLRAIGYNGNVDLALLTNKLTDLLTKQQFGSATKANVNEVNKKLAEWYSETNTQIDKKSYYGRFSDWTTYGEGYIYSSPFEYWKIEAKKIEEYTENLLKKSVQINREVPLAKKDFAAFFKDEKELKEWMIDLFCDSLNDNAPEVLSMKKEKESNGIKTIKCTLTKKSIFEKEFRMSEQNFHSDIPRVVNQLAAYFSDIYKLILDKDLLISWDSKQKKITFDNSGFRFTNENEINIGYLSSISLKKKEDVKLEFSWPGTRYFWVGIPLYFFPSLELDRKKLIESWSEIDWKKEEKKV